MQYSLFTILLAGLLASFVPNIGSDVEKSLSSNQLRILISNDDGVDSPGLHALTLALSEIAEVVVSAPSENCSGASHSSKVFSGVHNAKEIDIPGAVKAWSVGGTPADSVTWGVLTEGQEKEFDFVVSGINNGANVGEIAHYSGTIGAAMEGAGLNIPSIAVSQAGQQSFNHSCETVIKLIERLLKDNSTNQIIWAVDVPLLAVDAEPKITIAPMGGRYAQIESFDTKQSEDGEGLIFRAKLSFPRDSNPSSSTSAFQRGEVVITPLKYNWTDYDEVERMKDWSWE